MAANKALSEITKRFGITAREARDIATAVGTAIQSARNPNVLGARAKLKSPLRPTAGNVVKKQIKETITAAKTGKKGTTSPKLRDTGKKINLLAPGKKNNPIFPKPETMPIFKYEKGKKRK
jgi:hypothetical protein